MWFNKVTKDLTQLPAFIDYYENELVSAKNEVKIHGSLDKALSSLPGITEHRFSQLQEIEAILNHLEIELRRVKKGYFQKYLENYNRALSSRDAERYADGEPEVIMYGQLINEVSLLRNKYLSITKGLESKNFMLGHLTRLRVAGLDDSMV